MKRKDLKKKYSEVVEKIKIFQIPNNAILESILLKMLGREEFIDKTDVGDLIYSATIFRDIWHESLDDNQKPQFDEKTIEQLSELIILCEKCQYVMVIDNPQ